MSLQETYYCFLLVRKKLIVQRLTSRSVLPFNVDVNPNPRSAGAKLDVNDADLAKPIRFQIERNK